MEAQTSVQGGDNRGPTSGEDMSLNFINKVRGEQSKTLILGVYHHRFGMVSFQW